jgi:hypothetical protein
MTAKECRETQDLGFNRNEMPRRTVYLLANRGHRAFTVKNANAPAGTHGG